MPELVDSNEIDTIQFQKDVAQNLKSRHYIDDDHLTKILSDWKQIFDQFKEYGFERPPLPEAVGEAIYDMSESMGKRFNFAGYSYLDEMKSDAILHCVKYIHNFNPLKKSEKKGKVSAFGYINMIIWRSFTNRIKYEKQQQYLKYKSFELMGGMEAFQDEEMIGAGGEDGGDEGMAIGTLGADFLQKAREYEEEYLKDAPAKKEKVVHFDNFMFSFGDTEEQPEDDDELVIEFE